MRTLLLCTLLGLVVSFPAKAASDAVPPGSPLTLDDAIAAALANNFVVTGARLDPQIARANQITAAGAFDPEFSASFLRSDNRTERVDPLGGPRAPLFVDKSDVLELSVGGKLPFGLHYALVGSAGNYRDTDILLADNFSTYGGLRLTQPLLRGFGFGANLAGVRLARAQRGIAEATYRQAVIDTITRTITAYNNLYFAQQSHQNARRSFRLAEDLLKENQRRVEVGSISPADVTIAAARVARIEEGVLQSERAARDASNYLLTLVSDDRAPATDSPLAIAPPDFVATEPIDRAAALAQALARRPDYLQTVERIRRAEAGIAESRSAALPQLDLVGSYGYNGSGTSFDGAYGDARHRRTPSWTAGAVVKVPLPFRDGRGRLRAARLSRAQAENEMHRLEQQISIEIANAAGLIDTCRQRVDAARRARGLAADSLAAEQKRLQVGQSDTFTVLQFQELLASAEQAEYRAIADYNIARADFDRATGATLERHGVTLGD